MVIRQKINSDLKIIPQITMQVFKKLKDLKISDDELFDIRLCLEEALINAVKHGNRTQKDKKVFFKISILPASIKIEIKDEGKGFNYKDIPLPTLKKNLEKTSGRGIFLIKKLMDKVEFLDSGTRIRMIKYK